MQKHCNFLQLRLVIGTQTRYIYYCTCQFNSPSVGGRAHKRVGPMKGFENHAQKEKDR